MSYLYHLFASDQYLVDPSPTGLDDEGFVHLSSADQLIATAERWFAGASDLKVVVLEQSVLEDSLRWEDLYDHGELFAHLYAPIPKEAIVGVVALHRDTDGRYVWPELLGALKSPLLEPLSHETAVIEPTERFPKPVLPSRCLLCFFPELLDDLSNHPDCEILEGLGSEIGAKTVYQIERSGEKIAICHPGVGGSLAAATLEELIALGCERFLLCGGAGSLVPEQTLGHLVVVDRAWRDEGTSHHYLAPSATVEVESELIDKIARGLDERKVSFTRGATWTTDALYRETPSRVARRRQEGCLTVEMELASLLAVARYRGCSLGGVVYCGDDVGSDRWDFREWTSATGVRQRLFELCLEVLSEL